MAILMLAACAAPPSPEDPETEREAETTVDLPLLTDEDASHWMAQARKSSGDERNRYLIEAAAAYFDAEQWQFGAAILSQLGEATLADNVRVHYQLQRARLQVHFARWDEALSSLDGLEAQLPQRDERLLYMRLRYQALAGQERYLSSARQLVQLQFYDETDHSRQIWDYLSQVPAHYWRDSVRDTGDTMRGWSALFERMTRALDDRQPLAATLQRWQNSFPDHPAFPLVEELLNEQPWLHEQPRRIAVLLPLSGQFSAQGHAIRDGVLAALSNARNEDVLFIDTQTKDPVAILQQLEEENIEAVIGPLQREFVDRLAAELIARDEPRSWVHLWLNRAPADYPSGLDTFFALDSDTEVESATRYLDSEGHQRVLVMGPDTQRGRQLSNQFSEQWQQRFGSDTAMTTRYASGNDMPDRVEESLHVRASKSRIELVERAAGALTIESEPRSRRDVDAIYLVGDAAQARLLKPFIETSISPFATRLPMYATSAVHEQAERRRGSDLEGIIFSEAPWLLTEHEQRELFQRFAGLRSNWSPPIQRLVAMGYDSMELLPRLSSMQWFPGYDHPGLTGQLRISANSVRRQLHWAQFDSSGVSRKNTHEHQENRDAL
ncbi:penicillin-binding protein activator [Aliidiomarina sp. Khilg15.8]